MKLLRLRESFRIGWSSAKSNALPSIVLWAASVASVGAYFCVPGVSDALEPIARWHCAHEVLGAVVNRIVFCGVVPGLFMLVLPSIRPAHPCRTLLAETLWYAAWAVLCGKFYQLQSELFGSGNDAVTLLKKTLADQFVWTVFVIAPTNAVFFFWTGQGFSFKLLREKWPKDWVGSIFLPNLLANWCVWIPVMAIIYAFPLALQIQVAGFIGSFWTLMCLEIGRQSGRSGV